MRTNEERIAAMHQRAEQLQIEKRNRFIQVSALASGFIVVILLSLLIPYYAQNIHQEKIPSGMNASIFAQSNALGFIVVAILSFLLGIAVTIFCFYLKKGQK
ncbi:MAG: hypothetical protein IJI46_01225 [Erysipelotrichaceae bacterium]|nr:hypothetical protein [Erysipelotrichaceae bacterium]